MVGRLWSENGPDCASMNLAELAEIRRAIDIIRGTFRLDVILVADSGYRRKDLLHWLKKVEGTDFVIRLEGKLNIEAGKSKGLLSSLSEWWPKRMKIQWREKSKRVLLSDVSARRITVRTESKEAIDRLLDAAHMAYLVLVMMLEFARRGRTAATRQLMDQFDELLRSRFARPVEEMTLGRFLRLIAMDFPSPRLAGTVG